MWRERIKDLHILVSSQHLKVNMRNKKLIFDMREKEEKRRKCEKGKRVKGRRDDKSQALLIFNYLNTSYLHSIKRVQNFFISDNQ